jgi:endoribonuclease Nob1
MKILDSSGIINLRDGELKGSFLTVPGVVLEVRDAQSRMKFEAARDNGAIKVLEPDPRCLKTLEESCKKLGCLDLLSPTDKDILALAIETKLIVVTDDYDIQNVCRELGLKFETIMFKGVRSTMVWERCCTACGAKVEGDECHVCGSCSVRSKPSHKSKHPKNSSQKK